jgi:hypothetical protein
MVGDEEIAYLQYLLVPRKMNCKYMASSQRLIHIHIGKAIIKCGYQVHERIEESALLRITLFNRLHIILTHQEVDALHIVANLLQRLNGFCCILWIIENTMNIFLWVSIGRKYPQGGESNCLFLSCALTFFIRSSLSLFCSFSLLC